MASITKEFVDSLFQNEYFLEKLTDFIVDNLVMRQDYDAYVGKYDDLELYFNDRGIKKEGHSYGI